MKDEPKEQKLEMRKTIIIEASSDVVFKAITEPEDRDYISEGLLRNLFRIR